MPAADGIPSTRFDELKPGDRIAVRQTVTVGGQLQTVSTTGTVVRTERAHHGSCGEPDVDHSTHSDRILLELPDGELTTVTMDDSTELNRA